MHLLGFKPAGKWVLPSQAGHRARDRALLGLAKSKEGMFFFYMRRNKYVSTTKANHNIILAYGLNGLEMG